MSLAKAYTEKDTSWLQSVVGMFFKPARLQIAALCVRPAETENEILLVSTRDTGRLILPKGWPEPDQQAYETASTEAYEEAGVLGRADTRPLGTFRSYKGLGNGSKIRTKVMVFKLQFEKQLKTFPEIGQRECHWVPFSKGIELAEENALKRFLRRHRMEIA